MNKIILGFLMMVSVSAFATTTENLSDAKLKLVNSINDSVSPFQVTLETLDSSALYIASMSDRFTREMTRKFGGSCIRASFGSTTGLGHFIGETETLTVDVLLAPILEACY